MGHSATLYLYKVQKSITSTNTLKYQSVFSYIPEKTQIVPETEDFLAANQNRVRNTLKLRQPVPIEYFVTQKHPKALI